MGQVRVIFTFPGTADEHFAYVKWFSEFSEPDSDHTGDKTPCTEPVHAQYMVVPCPEYQHFPESEHVEFFQNTLNNVFAILQLSKL